MKCIIDFLESGIKNNGSLKLKNNFIQKIQRDNNDKTSFSMADKIRLLKSFFSHRYSSSLSHLAPVITYKETKTVTPEKKIFINNVLENLDLDNNTSTINIYGLFYIPEKERKIEELEKILDFYKLIKKYTYEYKDFGLSIVDGKNPLRIDIRAMYDVDGCDNRIEIKDVTEIFQSLIFDNKYLSLLFNVHIRKNLKKIGLYSSEYISGEYTLNSTEWATVWNKFNPEDKV